MYRKGLDLKHWRRILSATWTPYRHHVLVDICTHYRINVMKITTVKDIAVIKDTLNIKSSRTSWSSVNKESWTSRMSHLLRKSWVRTVYLGLTGNTVIKRGHKHLRTKGSSPRHGHHSHQGQLEHREHHHRQRYHRHPCSSDIVVN